MFDLIEFKAEGEDDDAIHSSDDEEDDAKQDKMIKVSLILLILRIENIYCSDS